MMCMTGAMDLSEMNRLAQETFNTVSLSTCAYCNRSFLSEKLLIHNRSCTADNPARKVGKVSSTPEKRYLYDCVYLYICICIYVYVCIGKE
jgi:hypothetical protein